MAATAEQILAALVTAVKSLTVANGYVTNLNPDNVFSRLTPLSNMQQNAAAYPRVFVISDGADYQDLPSHRIQKEERFTVLAVFAPDRSDIEDIDLETQVAKYVNDFELMIGRNKQMGGSDLVVIQTLATDVQTQETEAVAMFELTINYRRHLI